MFSDFHGLWAISPQYQNAILQALRAGGMKPVLQGCPPVSDQVQAASGFSYEAYYADLLSIGPDKDVVVIPVVGTMARGWTWDNYFSNTFMMSLLASIAENPAKKGVIFDFNTGGGTVDSLDEFAAAVQQFQTKKPIVALANFCASAGYYIASQCNEIIMRQGPVAAVGSIGTISFYYNYARMYEEAGIDWKIFRSTGSVDKAKMNGLEPLDAETEAEVQALLDACNKQFKAAVRTGRGAKLTSDEIYTGKLYGYDKAKRLGMVDRVGDMNAAYKRVIQLS
ncbi:hypothetical protein F5984_19825 [Rudanella paleaurantiibacter]|uniref:Peptidase S49 domain-containing protein n=1 Tax=Rudanella paleaurantiibacter TaxID=2614655 RepID=A0A7J5TX55_9BACT|nr:S49 family peptidase [Rudanella paleaurantiibacter]KAB7728006.1 hypothetical protein F5984_19825 [Rudanella paleaurantiibacter]